jgi:putative aldouronate transport system permease protein
VSIIAFSVHVSLAVLLPVGFVLKKSLDGAGEFTVFRRIAIPLSMPAIAAIALFTGVGCWNMSFCLVIFITKFHLYAFQVKLDQIMPVQQRMET